MELSKEFHCYPANKKVASHVLPQRDHVKLLIQIVILAISTAVEALGNTEFAAKYGLKIVADKVKTTFLRNIACAAHIFLPDLHIQSH